MSQGAASLADIKARRLIAHISAAVLGELEALLENDVDLLECVGMGVQNFRINFTARMWHRHHVRIDETIANATFFCLAEQVTARFGNTPVSELLDSVEETTAPTADDIINDWTVDTAMDDDARRALYGRDGSSQRELEIAKGEMRDELRGRE